MHSKFIELSSTELKEALNLIPTDPLQKTVILTECLRILGYYSVFKNISQNLTDNSKVIEVYDFELLHLGWNVALEHLSIKVERLGCPIKESTDQLFKYTINILHKFGRSVLYKRTADMIKSGFMNVELLPNRVNLKCSDIAKFQFIDNMEFSKLEEMSQYLTESGKSDVKGWKRFTFEGESPSIETIGSFLGTKSNEAIDNFQLENIDELMESLVYPWDSGYGLMVGYDAKLEVDNHFLSQALEMTMKWRDESGLHPSYKVDGVSGEMLTYIVAIITALHLKHIRLVLIAKKKHQDVSLRQSLIIWTPIDEMIQTVIDYASREIDLEKKEVKKLLNAITFQPHEVGMLNGYTTSFMPLLINIGNGTILRPISSLLKNPFISILQLQEWRNPKVKEELARPREDWFRQELYALFQGNKFKKIDGNINIRNGSKVVTDIDAAIFDTTTGELALFQIKWQDYLCNDVKKLRSKASNLTKELDKWTNKVNNWIEENGVDELTQTLRLKVGKHRPVSRVYLFGLSRTAARMKGFGFETKDESLAIASWPQFLRIRYEQGPVHNTFGALFDTLKQCENEECKLTPIPMSLSTGELNIHYKNLWNYIE
jgi:hypothetical protein